MALRKFFELNDKNEHHSNLTEFVGATGYDKGFVSHNDGIGHVHRYAYAGKLLTGALKDKKTILDVACGRNIELAYFLWRNRCPKTFEYWGADLNITENYVPAADKHWQVPLNLIRMDLIDDDPSQCEGWPGQFDLVVSYETYEHIPRDRQQAFVDRLFSWTKPGGTCLFSTPNAGVSDSTAENHIDPVTGESRERTYAEKVQMVQQAGFRLVDSFGVFCGTTRLPEEVQTRFKTDPEWKKIKKFLSHGLFTCISSIYYPEHSNNSLFHMERPL